MRPPGVRHTAATMMLDSGTTVSATAKWLGHDPAMTRRLYGHLYDEALASLATLCSADHAPAASADSWAQQ